MEKQSDAAQRLLKSTNSMDTISQYLSYSQLLEWQLINQNFYDKLVPEITRNRNLNPPVKSDVHIFLKEKTVYGLTLN